MTCKECGRQYGHLKDCPVIALHRRLDEFIEQHGAANVLITVSRRLQEKVNEG